MISVAETTVGGDGGQGVAGRFKCLFDCGELRFKDFICDGAIGVLSESEVEEPTGDLQVVGDVVALDAAAGVPADVVNCTLDETRGGRDGDGRFADDE